MQSVDINTKAVIAATLVNMILGAIWYSGGVFGKQWEKMSGKSLASMKENMARNYTVLLVWAFFQSYILAHFVQYAGANTTSEAIQTAIWLWVGFVASTSFSAVLFAGKKLKLWGIDSGYYLAVLAINAVLLVKL